jgi:hypothetical protein
VEGHRQSPGRIGLSRRRSAVKRVLFGVLALVGALVGPASPARAAGGGSGGGVPPDWVKFQQMKPAEVWHMMDPDNKGYVTKDEFMKFQDELFTKLDKKGEGKITPDEFMGHSAASSSSKTK